MLAVRYFYSITLLLIPFIDVTAIPSPNNEGEMANVQTQYSLIDNSRTLYKIQLPQQRQENRYQIELLFSLHTFSDCNHMRYFSTFEPLTPTTEDPVYRLASLSQPIQTKMACNNPPEWQMTPIIVADNLLIYNSKIPIVVDVPSDVIVSYRVWTIQDTVYNATRL